ncbi:MAG TPA: hypothetical protein VJ385_00390 [Fibrobacteria bacterium]|nr:hypothetical protein [Fibrobacteria bacterium]
MRRLNLCVLGAGLLLGACAKTATQSAPVSEAQKQAEAERKLCTNMNNLKASVQEYPEITSETPLDSIQQANARVDKAVREVKDASKDVNNPRILDVQAAYQELQNSLNTVPGGRMTVGEAADSIRADAREFRNAWDRLYNSMECGA